MFIFSVTQRKVMGLCNDTCLLSKDRCHQKHLDGNNLQGKDNIDIFVLPFSVSLSHLASICLFSKMKTLCNNVLS